MHGFAYVAPASQAEVIELLQQRGSTARLLAGGTDLVVGLHTGRIRPRLVVDLKRVAELRPAIERVDESLVVAATTPMSRLIRDERMQRQFPALVEAASTVGSVQIRNRATLAGNLCNASPAADTLPALLIYGARAVISGPSGTRRLPVGEFMLGPRRTALGLGELVAAIELPIPRPGSLAAFGRLTRRRGVDLATISVCCSVDPNGTTTFAYGAVAPVPFLVADETGVLADLSGDAVERERLLQRMTLEARPISDVRASRQYRQSMLTVLSRRLLRSVLERREEDA